MADVPIEMASISIEAPKTLQQAVKAHNASVSSQAALVIGSSVEAARVALQS
jgi:hypothetical protein